MQNIDWSAFKVRCSAIGDVLSENKSNPPMTESQDRTLAKYRKTLDAGKRLTLNQADEMAYLETKEKNTKKLILSESCIKYLMTEYAWITEGMIPVGREQLNLVAARKGNITELEGILLLSKVDQIQYKIHKTRIYNEYLSGEIDAYSGEEVMKAICIVDNKASYDYPTYLCKIHSKVENDHKNQVKGYIDITGARVGYVSNTLVNCPQELIEEARWSLTRKMNAATPESPEVMEVWPTWERSMIFDRISYHKRVHKVKIEPFTDHERKRLYDKVKVCREWLNSFHEEFQKKNL
jgi:hypothetical protein